MPLYSTRDQLCQPSAGSPRYFPDFVSPQIEDFDFPWLQLVR
jgi:hypothetical protein